VAAPDLLPVAVLILMAVVAAVAEIQLVQVEWLQELAYLVKVLLAVAHRVVKVPLVVAVAQELPGLVIKVETDLIHQ
jgi:hypothetical protein